MPIRHPLVLVLVLVLVATHASAGDRIVVAPEERDAIARRVVLPDGTPAWRVQHVRLVGCRGLELLAVNPTVTPTPEGEWLEEDGDVLVLSGEQDIQSIGDRIECKAIEDGSMPYWSEVVRRAREGAPAAPGLLRKRLERELGSGERMYAEVAMERLATGAVRVSVGRLPAEGKPALLSVVATLAGGAVTLAERREGDLDGPTGAALRSGVASRRLEAATVTASFAGAPATIRADRLTAHCVGDDAIALRALDGAGRLLWRYEGNDLCGRVAFAAADLDGDGADEVLVVNSDHGRVTLRIFSGG